MDSERVRAFVAQLPKCEVHLHFEGAVPMPLVRRWAATRIPERPAWREPDYVYGSFSEAFGDVMRLTWRDPVNSLARLDEASTAIYSDLFEQNVRYLEMSIGIGAYPYPVSETMAAFKSGVPGGMTVRIIGGLSRDRDVKLIRAAGRQYLSSGMLDGLDVHGDETIGDAAVFVEEFDRARRDGLILKAHAGEMVGPESVEHVLDTLKVDRVAHGVRGIESDRLLQRYLDEDVTLDVCPWSNVKLGVYPDLETHPVARLHRAGVRVTVGTDDPTPFGHTLTDEYTWLMTACGMTVREVAEIAKNGFAVAWMDEGAKAKAVDEIDAVVTEYDR